MILTSLLAISSLLTLARATPMSFTTYRRRELPVDEGAELVLLYDQKGFENTDSSPRSVYELERAYANEVALQQQQRRPEMGEIGTSNIAEENEAMELGARGAAARGANKRAIGSLSIVNPVDVLRSRVILELARRRSQQQQRQAAENRRILETIGKRSVHQLSSNPNGYTGNVALPPVNNAGVIYGKAERENVRGNEKKQRVDQTYTQRIPIGMRSHDWYETDENAVDDDDDDDDASMTTRVNGDGNNTRKVAATYRQERI